MAAGAGFLGSAALLLAGAPSLAPVASAGTGTTGVELSWAVGTPATLPAGSTATLLATYTAPDTVAGDVVVGLQLANARAGGLPDSCLPDGVTPPSSISTDGLRVVCDLGPVAPQQVVTLSFPVVAGRQGALVGVQAGSYDNQGVVLTRPVAGPAPQPYYRLLSSPDFLNADVADLRTAPHATWRPGQPNSWNPTYKRLLDRIISDWASFHPDAVTVPGDLVNGRWMKDLDRVAAFGPVDTPRHRRDSIRRAARTYFSAWKQRFVDARLTVYPGIGDHDLGDNPWAGDKISDEKREDAPLFRSLFESHFTRKGDGSHRFADRPVGTPWEGTAYALRPDPHVQLVMLDVFRTITGDTIAEVSGGQLAWLEGVLAKAQADGVDWIVVEGHTPILGPVRRGPSSGLMYRGGSQSALWALFQQYGVDVYLCGEVHASTAIVRDGIVQVSHGGNVGYGNGEASRGGTSFLVSDFSAGGLSMTLYSWKREHGGDVLWQMAGNRIPEFQRIVSDPIDIGSVSITNNGTSSVNDTIVTERSGLLSLFDPAEEPGPYSAEWLPTR